KPVPVFDGINKDLQDYLAAPVPLKLSVDLSKQETSIESLFAALAAADKYVDLDLSGCTGLTEWGAYTDAGKVVSLVLPDTVTKIAEGTVSAGTFASFTSLKAFKANKTETVGKWAFYGCAALASADLPAATVIGEDAFYGCAALASANLPAATAIEGFAFSGCSALASINAPSAATIGSFAFDACTAIASINLPAAATIRAGAFRHCTSLASISLPLVETIERLA
ncbi:leucine-rich repeat domain-containing protein, partial [Treponema endosymbiont of Eucomonympha sp.]|uniref:leucine-rich repeat domain-containing protein n=1 Tax=Treponema endosymbiont of Eucomonympha sp. TaxID=1580831 RepID=UPI000B1E2933